MSSSLSGFTGMGSRGQRGASGNTMGQRMSGDIAPKGYNIGQLQQFTPEQQGLFQQLFGHVGPGSSLSRLASGDESQFAEIEAPALRQFQGLQGQLASRFSGMGSLGARKSSGFQNAIGAEASNFAQDLASKRQGLQRQALMDLMGMSNQLLGQRPYERALYEKPQSFLQQLGIGLSGGVGQGLGKSVAALFGA